MDGTGRGVDFITVDGGEGGTGAAPLVYSDHVALPFKWGFPRVYRAFAERDLQEEVVFIGSGKLGLPENALLAMALGCDLVNVGRTAMFAIGCVQAQRCHTGRCPTGVATQSAWLQSGLVPTDKGERVANYLAALRFELVSLGRTCGRAHPGLVTPDQLELLDVDLQAMPVDELFGYRAGWGLPSASDRSAITAIMAGSAVA